MTKLTAFDLRTADCFTADQAGDIDAGRLGTSGGSIGGLTFNVLESRQHFGLLRTAGGTGTFGFTFHAADRSQGSNIFTE